MQKDGGGGSRAAGQECSADGGHSGKIEEGKPFCENAESADFGDVTAQERAVLSRFLNRGKMGGAQGGRARSMALAALKFAAVLLVGAGIVQGYGDGDDFDEVGCTVAQQPGGGSHRGHSHGSPEDGGGKMGDPEGAGGDGPGGGGPDGPPEVRAAKGDKSALEHMDAKIDVVLEKLAAIENGRAREVEACVSESEAQRIFLLVRRLEGGPQQWKAPLGMVFRLTVLEGHSQAKAARLCGCVPALISRRVKTIESRFEMSIEQLRNFASTILEMEASVKGDRTRKKKRGAARDGTGEDEDGLERADLVEDANGYLHEERPDCGE
jgi:hypothetical protein